MLEIGDFSVNCWAILASAVASVIVGSLWYGPLFGKIWMKESGIQKPEKMTPEIKSSMMKSYGITTVGALLMAFVIGYLVNVIPVGVDGWCLFAFLLWIGFIVPTTALNSVLWEGKSWKLYGIGPGAPSKALSISSPIRRF